MSAARLDWLPGLARLNVFSSTPHQNPAGRLAKYSTCLMIQWDLSIMGYRFFYRRMMAWPWIVAFLVVIPIGCGKSGSSKPASHLRGAVTIAGSPLPENATGSITFQPTTRDQAQMATVDIQDSRYDAPAVPMGSVRVYFNVQRPTGRTFDIGRGAPQVEYENIVPAESASGLDLEVSGDKSDQDFDL